MASYRPSPPPQSSFGPPSGQNPILPAHPQQPRDNQFNQNWGYGGRGNAGGGGDGAGPPAPPASYQQNYNQMHPNSNYHQAGYGSSSQSYGPQRSQHTHPPPSAPQPQYSYPPPPPESSYPAPPPPPPQSGMSVPQSSMNLQPPQHQIYYPSSQYSQYNQSQMQPPPPPSSSPRGSSGPPPPPSSPPPVTAPPPKGSVDRQMHERNKEPLKGLSTSSRHELGRSNFSLHHKQHKPPLSHIQVNKSNGPPSTIETEEERRLRKKKEYEKQRQEEKHRLQLKESQNTILQKTQILSSGKGQGSIVGSRVGERRNATLLSGERMENRLKKPTTFLCKLKFRNELPDPSAQPKLMAFKKDKDQYTKYRITSLENIYKPKLFVEPDLGIPLDLLDLRVYNPPKVRPLLALEDEELLHDDETVTPIKRDGIRKKERPTDKGVAWLVKTQYISPLSTESMKQSLTEKQVKELREMKGGKNILDNLNDRERQIKDIEASFEAAKMRPIHATNKSLYPVEVLPLLPDFDRYEDQLVVASFDSAPTADSEIYKKLDPSIRDACESRAVMKSYAARGPNSANPEKFLAYMAPAAGELSKDMYDEHEDISYIWVREYHWDVRGEDADDPTTYLVSFDKEESRYVPLPRKLVLRKKRTTEGKSSEDVEQFLTPSGVTVRKRPLISSIEVKDDGDYGNLKGISSSVKRRGSGRLHRVAQEPDNYHQYSGAEDEMSD